MAEKNESKAKQTTERKIICKGPVDKNNGATFLRFSRDSEKKEDILISTGQVLAVGEDITITESKRLLQTPNWNFEEGK
jgi:hypothetical protein